ncbi:MAG: GNAT family N-acetyltransferase [Saprospiraceae bacterium]|nr:GNAT family N-acetyltransferase [Saprospiraceae bacterium]
MNITIRKANLADLQAIHDLVRELAVYEKAEPEFVASLADYQSDFEAGIFDAHVAAVDGKVVGMALYYMTYSTWKGRMFYLEDFVVQEEYRGHGLGQKLFDAFLQEARDRKCRLVKWQVLDWNEPALRFYRRNNAVIEKEWWNGKIFLTEIH